MRKIICSVIVMALAATLQAVDIMKLSDVREGMKGEGKTIFKGSTIETFTFDVLGILKNVFPNKSLIIVDVHSPVLSEGGVLAGMSGSPVYINGKLIGAVAYSLTNFAKRPIAGVTPIEDILATANFGSSSVSVDVSRLGVDFSPDNLVKLKTFVQQELLKRTNFSPDPFVTPIRLLSISRGFDPQTTAFLQPVFTPLNNLSSSLQLKSEGLSSDSYMLQAADAASVPLVRGDFEYSASGTVTMVEGNKIYLFGHPFFNLGKVSFPLHKAKIITVIPSYQTSFKVASSYANPAGTVVQDRSSAIQGVLGKFPYMIPFSVYLRNRNHRISLEMVDHPLLTPAISYISLLNIFTSQYQQFGFQSLAIRGKIFIENERNVIINDLYSGTESFTQFSNLIFAINFYLLNNKDKKIKIQKIDFDVQSSEQVRRSTIENVIINKNIFAPGESITISVYLRNERGQAAMKRVNLKAPSLKPGSTFYLMIADKDALGKFDARNVRTSYFPTKLSSLIRIINNIRKNNRIYFKLMRPSQGLFIKGHEYSNLPASVRNIFRYNSTSDDQTSMKLSTIGEYQLAVPTVVKGNKLFQLKIKAR